jgi:membrane-anchored mycosin MYCP
VAVVDTGVDIQNVQLASVLNRDMRPASFVLPDVDTVPPTRDCDGHGTFVAGIIAARAYPGVSFTGVAPHAQILPVRVSKGETSGSAAALADGINYAVEQGADIINVSLVTDNPLNALRDAVANALRQGVVVVVAAGNTGDQGNGRVWPAEFARDRGFEGLIVVGATDESGAVAAFSTTSVPVTVAAPGQDVWSTAPIHGHRQDKGTSFAAPFVSGVAALILEAYGKKLTPVQVKRRLELTADPPGRDVPDPGYGYGIVNPYQAVTAILPDQSTASRAPDNKPAIKRIAVQKPADTTDQQVALGVAAGALLLGLATLGAVATIRRGRARNWQPS